jgi:PAS domain S-box-containing protein
MRQAFASYRQLDLVDLTELSYQDLLQRVAALPPRTVMLFFSCLRDRTGEVFVTTDVLRTLTRVGRAPIHVVSDTLVAAGGLGGYVVSFAAIGRQTAAIAKQALAGAAPDAAAKTTEATSLYMFNAPVLKRWGVAEGALPAGSVVIHREESIWRRYRWPLVVGIAFVVLQSTLITSLLVQRRQRARAQAAQARSLNFERLVSEISTLLSTGASAEVDAELPDALLRVARQLGFDRASLFEFDDFDDVHVVSSAASDAALPATLPVVRFPWTFEAVKAGGLVQWPARRRMSTAAEEDRTVFAELGIEAFVCIPLSLDSRVVGALALAAGQPMTEWAAPLIERARLLGEVLGNFIVRRRTESAVRESEARFRLMADSAPVMVWMAGVDGGRTYFSKQWLEFTGRRLEDQLGMAWAEDIHPDDRAQCLEIWRKRFEIREEFVLEYRLQRRDCEYRWVADRGVPRFSRHGTFHGYVGGSSDITELKAAHEALLETVKLRGEIFGSLYGHVAAVDRAGRIIAVNESWSASHKEEGGRVLRPPVGRDYLADCRAAAANGDASAEHQRTTLQVVLDGRARRASTEYVSRSSHDERWYEMTVEPFHRSDGGAIVTHIDITRRRRAEAEARREREQLAHALRVTTLGELAASLAHEIHQPLAAILSNAQAAQLVLEKQAELDNEVRGALVDIVDDAKRAALVIRRLRALFRKDESAQRKPVDVNAIIIEVIGLVRGELELKHVAIDFDPGPGAPPVFGDAIQLQQVILNVIVNASEAMVGTDTPDPRVGVQTITTNQGTVEIIISDRGTGVAEAELERIFEPFVTTKTSGLGMGLSISRSIVQAHGGRIWATGRAGGGLTVNIELPCEEQSVPA